MNKAQRLVIIQFILFGVMVIAMLLLPDGQSPIVRLVGLLLMLAGPVFALWAIAEHGRHNAAPPRIVPTPDERAALIQTGLYTWIRHPIYTGVLTAGLGAAIAHGHILMLAIAGILAIFFTVKARYEEALLSTIYPEYAAYRKRTGRFLPPLLRK